MATLAVLVPPTIQAQEPVIGIRFGTFGFFYTGQEGKTIVIEGSTNLESWIPVETNIMGKYRRYFEDPPGSQLPMRYYRLKLQDP